MFIKNMLVILAMSDIYYEIILDHYRYPRNKGHIEDADIRVRDSNPLCGDEVEYTIKLDEKKKRYWI